MFRYVTQVSVIIACALTASCATLSEEECRTVDWRELGERDGLAGFRKGRIGDHARSCAEHDLFVDQAEYLAGWRVGIPRFCTAQNGYDRGIEGKSYYKSCPSNIAAPFENAYDRSSRVYSAERDVDRISERIDVLQSERFSLRGSDDPKAQERLAQISRDLGELRSELRSAQREESRARDALLLFLTRNPDIRP